MNAAGGLGGFTVLEVSSTIAGAHAGRLLASYGADVIKVEDFHSPDPIRRTGPYAQDDPNPEKSLPFHYLNAGKRGITLNLRCPSGVSLFKQLVEQAAAVVEDLGAGEMEGLGLGYAVLEAIQPKLSMTSISPFGQSGPYNRYKAPHLIQLAMSGRTAATGHSGKPPLNLGAHLGEYMPGVMGALATAIALYDAEDSNTGNQVDLAASATNLFTSTQTLAYAYSGAFAPRADPDPGYNRLECADGFLGVHFLWTPAMIQALSQLLGLPDMLEYGAPTSVTARLAWTEKMSPLIAEKVRHQSRWEIFHRAMALGLPFGLFLTTDEIVQLPPLQERGYFVEVNHPVTGTELHPGAPILMGDDACRFHVNGGAPTLGQHNADVFGSLGYSHEDIRVLREQGVI